MKEIGEAAPHWRREELKEKIKRCWAASNAAKKSRGTKGGKGMRSDNGEAIVCCTVGLVEWEGEVQRDEGFWCCWVLQQNFAKCWIYRWFSAEQSRSLVNTTWWPDTAFSYRELPDLTYFVLHCDCFHFSQFLTVEVFNGSPLLKTSFGDPVDNPLSRGEAENHQLWTML